MPGVFRMAPVQEIGSSTQLISRDMAIWARGILNISMESKAILPHFFIFYQTDSITRKFQIKSDGADISYSVNARTTQPMLIKTIVVVKTAFQGSINDISTKQLLIILLPEWTGQRMAQEIEIQL